MARGKLVENEILCYQLFLLWVMLTGASEHWLRIPVPYKETFLTFHVLITQFSMQ